MNSNTRQFSIIELMAVMAIPFVILGLSLVGAQASQSGDWATQVHRLSDLGTLKQNLEVAEEKSAYYQQNAPRNYEDYFRDTTISYKNLLIDLEHMQMLVDRLIESPKQGASGGKPSLDLSLLEESWKQFKSGHSDQIGVDPEMPRLEWASEYFADNSEDLRQTVDTLYADAVDTLNGSSSGRSSISLWTWSGLLAWFFFVPFWFKRRM